MIDKQQLQMLGEDIAQAETGKFFGDASGSASPWVSVSDRLPNFGSTVLVQFITNVGGKQYTTADYVNLKICTHSDTTVPTWFVTVSGGHRLNTVTHWAPLPEPPKHG